MVFTLGETLKISEDLAHRIAGTNGFLLTNYKDLMGKSFKICPGTESDGYTTIEINGIQKRIPTKSLKNYLS